MKSECCMAYGPSSCWMSSCDAGEIESWFKHEPVWWVGVEVRKGEGQVFTCTDQA